MRKTGLFIRTVSRLILFGLICLLAFPGNSKAQNRKKIDILHCDLLDVNEQIVANARRLLGNVNITVDGALMWCDSLYSYTNNTVDAFGNVHIVRGDTLNMYADFVNYDGNIKFAKARRNVRLIDKEVTLTTDSLDYSMVNDLASYNYNGTVTDSTNVLNSVIGQYYVNEKKAYFKTKVDAVTKDYRIKSDTLIYFTDTKKVFIEGPTHIYNEKDTLYSEYGWYDSMNGIARLTKKSRIWNEKQKVKADSIFYDKPKGEGLAMGNARIQDIENKIIVVGNRIEYNDITKIAFATDSAMLIQYSETDSLYLHADYLRTMPDTTITNVPEPEKKLVANAAIKILVPDSLNNAATPKITASDSLIAIPAPFALTNTRLATDTLKNETLVTDTLHTDKKKDARLVLAYHKVRFFRDDFQGKCDSLAYWSKDSTIQLFIDPVIWSARNQISAKYIEMINRTKDPDEIRMKEDAFIVSMEDDSIRYNQIKGKNMVGYIHSNELTKIDVNGNGQSNYYASDQTGIIGLNKAESSNITIYMNKGKVKKIAFIKSPEGELKPLGDLDNSDKLLPGFKWLADIRPKNKEDIFRHPVSEEVPATIPEIGLKPKNKTPLTPAKTIE